jgi:hypothetical protein
MRYDQEDREALAARLRGPYDVLRQGRYVYVSGSLFGMQLAAESEKRLREATSRLADLIDPTCQPVHSDECSEDELVCNRCGASLGVEICGKPSWVPRYCSSCGSRVVMPSGR